ncbi:rho GTPase-activating protein 19-like [Stegastes partitus]|uniref:Rho GTPase-activating protein 19-like n=1 Tax=Stegastes partitus TaxID=144197 RepID=A0A9Y4N5B2_9TELE|nr:PREDICTED: rho GTPase-activating protein 19-like [Stegastes partitus]
MAAGKDVDENTQNRRGTACSVVMNHEESPGGSHAGRPPVIFNPDFFVEKLRHENPDVFLELVLSNITRLIDLPGTEFAQLLGEESPKTPTGGNGGFFRSFNFLKRKDKGVVFGTPLTESCIAQIYQLIEYLSRNLHVEGLFRVPGNSVRQQALKELLNSGADVDLESGDFHPNDVATLLKTFLGELPEPLLTHRHFHAHLKIDDLELLAASSSPAQRTVLPLKRAAVLIPSSQEQCQSPAQQYTEEALKDLFRHVHHNMPDSAKKKKLVRQLVKQTTSGTPTNEQRQAPPAPSKKHPRSRSFGGLIKRKARGEQLTAERRLRHISPEAVARAGRKPGKENVILQAVNSPLNGPVLGKAGLVVKNPDFAFHKGKGVKVSKKDSPSASTMCFSPAQEISL